MHSLWLVLDFIGSYYVTVGFIAGAFSMLSMTIPGTVGRPER